MASSRDRNQFSFRHSSRSRLLNDSMNALSVGFPGLDGSGFRGTTTVAALCQNPQGHRVIPQQRGSVGPADQEASRQR
jgi:hypothetical protein